MQAETAGAGYEYLFRREEIIQSERRFIYRDFQLFAHTDQVCPCDTRKNQVIRGGGAQHAILDDVDITVGTLRYTPAGTVEDRFLASGLLCFFRSKDGWEQIQSFHVAVEKAGVLDCDQLQWDGAVEYPGRCQRDPEISAAFSKYMLSGPGAACYLNIDK